jgi:superfamily II DNA or RNA helicase
LRAEIDYADNECRYKVYKIYSGARNNISMQDADLVCGTFQSLINYPEDFFYQFDIVIGDEAHKAAAESIKQILMNCHRASYRFGITGSMPGETTLERLTIESYIGAYIGQMTAMDLVDLGILPEFVIKQMVIQHSDELDAPYIQYIHNNPHVAFDSTRLLAAEQHHIMHCLPGNDLIAQVVINLDMNTLVLCKRRDHIDEIANILNAYITKTNSTKQVHVIKGGVSMGERKHIKSLVDADPYNHIIVATIGTMAMGVSINALFYAFLIMYGHSEFNSLQGVGRLLRKHPEKNVATIIDTAHKLATNCIPTTRKCLLHIQNHVMT